MAPSADYDYSTETDTVEPVAIIAPDGQDTVVGAVVRLDGRASFSPSGANLTFSWTFKQVPIGSQVEADGFKALETDTSVVSFAPDVTGLYVIQLVVNDGSFDSDPATSDVNTKVVLVPQNQGLVPDTSWVWNFLSDFWTRVEQRQRFEVFWSAAIQIIAAEQLKLWQYDYNKSIKDIQDLIQKRWLAYEPKLDLDAVKTSFILADDQAGLNASTYLIDTTSNGVQVDQPVYNNFASVPITDGNFAKTAYGSSITTGRVLQLGDQSFTLARAGVATRAVDIGTDGATVSGGNVFHGSAFSSSMVGMYLKILSGTLSGTVYQILTFVSSTIVTVKNLDGSAVSFTSSVSGLSYSVYPATPNANTFFADQNLVPAEVAPLSWRFSPTLISTEYDFEALGVSPGDVLVVQVTRTDTQQASSINLQVVSVDRNRLGFVYNTLDLVDGVAASGISQADQVKLAQELQVPGLMVSNVDQSLVYTDQALTILTLVQSTVFKRSFYETALSSSTVIPLGPFSVTFTPLKIIRNSKLLVDTNIRSIPSLQEYVKQPVVVEQDGGLFQVAEGKLYSLDRAPYTVFENADYVLDDETGISGTCTTTAGSTAIVIPFGDLNDRSVRQGDRIVVVDGVNELTFDIVAVTDPETLQVSQPVAKTLTAVPFTIQRDVTGTFIRFVKGTFTKARPAPERLWAEVTFFDNGQAVEDNFGVLVGVLRTDLSSVGATISYKNAVAGLMYALTNGPTVANLQLASQILLGLPFTTNAGTIIEIDPAFKVRADGSPLLGRIVINAEDATGKAIGITNIYFYPQGKQIPDPGNPGQWLPSNPTLSGLAINPTTGVEYRLGDHVDKFAALSKGTQVRDYLTDSSYVQEAINQGNVGFSVQRYHSFQLLVNADITTAIDTDLVAQFIRKAKPTYTKLSLALSKELQDDVVITDAITFDRNALVFDNPALSLPQAVTTDGQTVDAGYMTVEGAMFEYLIAGTDLVTTQSSLIVASATGGFITAPAGASHDGSFILPGYLLKIRAGVNQGLYVIASVGSNTSITLQSTDYGGSTFVFETLTGQDFAIYRPMTAVIAQGSCSINNNTSSIIATFGLFSTGVTAGDRIVLSNASGPGKLVYRVLGVNIGTETITIDKPITEANGTYTVTVYRDALFNRYYGHTSSEWPLLVNLQTVGSQAQAVVQLASPDLALATYAQPGDILITDDAQEFEVLDYNSGTIILAGTITTIGVKNARLERQDRADAPGISLDILDRIPSDSLYLVTTRRSVASGGSGPDLTTTAGSAVVSTVSGVNFDTGLGILPGDYIIILEGSDSFLDVGYGTGVYPIQSISGTSMTLTRALIQTNGAPGILYGIQRRRPNER